MGIYKLAVTPASPTSLWDNYWSGIERGIEYGVWHDLACPISKEVCLFVKSKKAGHIEAHVMLRSATAPIMSSNAGRVDWLLADIWPLTGKIRWSMVGEHGIIESRDWMLGYASGASADKMRSITSRLGIAVIKTITTNKSY